MKAIYFFLGLCLPLFALGQQIEYQVDLRTAANDQLQVQMQVSGFTDETLELNFPMTIPGTYATLDYGRYISEVEALDSAGQVLPINQKGKNTWEITQSQPLARVRYKIDDTFDAGTRKNKVFEPAGTNIQPGQNFLFNAGGVFGFFKGYEKIPLTVRVEKDENFWGITALPQLEGNPNLQTFEARDYHQLVDCPMMFAWPDTTSFQVANTRVSIGVFNESGRVLSKEIYDQVKTAMEAVAELLDQDLPVSTYAFVFYIKDLREYEGVLFGPRPKIGELVKVFRELNGQGFGALEHGNSSIYFMPDFGNDFVLDDIASICIHEFLHIVTPLNLHSEYIGDFDFIDPKMSQHLWLYEGITEYFAGISQVKGGVITPSEYLDLELRPKIVEALEYPEEKMSFTEMSKNVLKNPWKKQYNQVYQRGAVLGAMLDLEIMRLTGAKQTLKDVVVKLSKKYGPEKSFSERDFIAEFVAEVDPDLQVFFDRYITGTTPIDLRTSLGYAGIDYHEVFVEKGPANPLEKEENDVRVSPGIIGAMLTVTEVGENDFAGLQEGDQVDPDAVASVLRDAQGNWRAAGDTLSLTVMRGGEEVELRFVPPYVEKTTEHRMIINEDENEKLRKVYRRWMSNKPD
ncbi:MAG: hypothetical protein AAFR61_26065 [Bacteroidota bacterium]